MNFSISLYVTNRMVESGQVDATVVMIYITLLIYIFTMYKWSDYTSIIREAGKAASLPQGPGIIFSKSFKETTTSLIFSAI